MTFSEDINEYYLCMNAKKIFKKMLHAIGNSNFCLVFLTSSFYLVMCSHHMMSLGHPRAMIVLINKN